MKEELGVDHPECAQTLSLIANVVRSRGDYRMALDYYRMAAAVLVDAFGQTSLQAAAAVHDIAATATAAGFYNVAVDQFHLLIGILEEACGMHSLDLATAHGNLAMAMAPLWHHGTIAPRAPLQNEKNKCWKNAQKYILVLRAF